MKKFLEKNFRTPIRYINEIKSKLHDKNRITKELILNYLPEKSIILEAGACDGGDTIEWSEILPESTIYAFEPVPKNYEKLVENTKNYKNIITSNLALAEKTGEITMHVSNSLNSEEDLAYSSSILEPTGHLKVHESVDFKEKIQIKTINLDEWAENNNVKNIDFMWLDLQGAEFEVLNAAPKVLNSLKVLYTEVSLIELYKNTLLYKDFKKWLISKGFTVLREDIPWKDVGNVLFIKK